MFKEDSTKLPEICVSGEIVKTLGDVSLQGYFWDARCR